MIAEKRFRWGVWAVIGLALGLRLLAAGYWQFQLHAEGKSVRFGDSDSYWVLAQCLANGEPYQYSGENSKIFRAPLYPIVLAPIVYACQFEGLRSFNDWLPYFLARCVGAIGGTLCVALVMLSASKIAGRIAALMAGSFAAIYPGAIGMSVFILSEAIFCPLMLLSLYASWQGLQIVFGASNGAPNGAKSIAGADTKSSEVCGKDFCHQVCSRHLIGWSSIAGIAYGAGCLARPSWSIWGVLLAIYVGILIFTVRGAHFRGAHYRKRIVASGLLLAVTAASVVVVMSPWWIRNYSITGKFVPTTLQVGPSLYDGLHPGATGSSDEGMQFVESFWYEQADQDQRTIAAGKELESTYEWRLNRIMQDAAKEWVLGNPVEFAQLAAVKFFKTWRPVPVAAEVGNPLIKYSEGICYTLIVVVAAWGMWNSRHLVGSWIFTLPCIYFSLLHMVFIGSIRYRQPAVLVLCVLAGVGLASLLESRSKTCNASKAS